MAAVTMRHGRGANRSSKFRGRYDNEEGVKLDFSKDPAENVHEILTNIVKQQNVTKSKKLGFLNAFVKMLYRSRDKPISLGYSYYRILCCLRVCILHEAKEVRAATLRVIRYLINDECIDVLVELHIDYLIARSLDICLDNEIERVHAMRLIRKILVVNPHKLPSSLIFPMVAIGNDGSYERDRLINISLATICEIAIKCPASLVKCAGITTILRNIVDSHLYPRINECLVSTILHLLNHPQSRRYVNHSTHLEQLLAPFTDCHFRFSPIDSDIQPLDEKENRYTACRMAVVTIMRSWPGLIRLCRPDSQGLQSLFSTLYLTNNIIRKAVLDVVYEVFRLTPPCWTSDFSAGLHSVDASRMREEWRMMNGFVVYEGRALLPHLSHTRTNLVDNHMALVLSAWISAGLLEALVGVVTTCENELFVHSIILLGQLLHMAGKLLPDEISYNSHCLPSLLTLISSPDADVQTRRKVSVVVRCLARVHTLHKRHLTPCSLYLTHITRYYPHHTVNTSTPHRRHSSRAVCDEIVIQSLKDTNVSDSVKFTEWHWDLIDAILQRPHNTLLQMTDQTVIRFVKCLVHFYRPSSQQYADVEESCDQARLYTSTGCHFVAFLHAAEGTAQKQLLTLFEDISVLISEVTVTQPAYEAQLGMNNITCKLVAHYFILIGHMTALANGQQILHQAGIFHQLLELVTVNSHEVYMKLSIACLDYSQGGMPLVILSKAINSGSESSRLYATKFLQILLRARVPNFSTWGMEMLVTQIYDTSRPVAMAALGVIEEACEQEAHLSSIIKMRPSLLHLGDRGAMMVCRFMSVTTGFKFLSDANYVSNELQRWYKAFNTKYVSIVEELLNEALTTYERTYDGSYTRRSNVKRPDKDVYVPVHLYGQLVQHQEGLTLLRQQEYMREYFDCVRNQELITLSDCVKLKTALWALGHIGTSAWGITWLQEEGMIPVIIKLAEESAVFSIRGTAFYVLGLIASTRQGCTHLAQLGWEAVWHDRSEKWPLIEEHCVISYDDDDDLAYGGNTSLPVTPNVGGAAFFVGEKCVIDPADDVNNSGIIDDVKKDDDVDNGSVMDYESSVDGEKSSTVDVGIQATNVTPLNHETSNRSSSMTLTSQCDSINTNKEMNGVPSTSTSPSPVTPDRRKSIAERTSELRAKFLSDFGQASHGSEPILNEGVSSFDRRNSPRKKKRHISESETCVSHVLFNNVVDNKLCNSEGNIDKYGSDEISGANLTSSPITTSNLSNLHIKCNNFIPNTDSQITEHWEDNTMTDKNLTDSCFSCDETIEVSEVTDKVSLNDSNEQNDTNKREKSNTLPITHSETPTYGQLLTNQNLTVLGARRRIKSDIPPTKLYPKSTRSHSNYNDLPKPRSNSFNTTTTSGVGSLSRSDGIGSFDSNDLSPYRNSKNTNLDLTKAFIHPSSIKRRMANLTRIPSIHRRTRSPISPPLDDISCSSSMFRNSRSEWGYVTLRNLKRQLTSGSERDSDVSGLSEERDRGGSIGSGGSLTTVSFPLSPSCASLSNLDVSSANGQCQALHQHLLDKVHKASTGETEFVGVCLPIDVAMMFEVNEGEDRRTSSADSAPSPVVDEKIEVDISQSHDVDNCLACCREKGVPLDMSQVQISITEVLVSEAEMRDGLDGLDTSRLRAESFNTDTLSSSCGSHTDDSGSQKMSDESPYGRMLIRKEMMRYMMSLASSIGTKAAEQGLLFLKQKFPTFFQSVCVYSDICHLLASYTFRLNARRFIQELFDELNLQKLYTEPTTILGLDQDNTPKMATIHQSSEITDDFADTFM